MIFLVIILILINFYLSNLYLLNKSPLILVFLIIFLIFFTIIFYFFSRKVFLSQVISFVIFSVVFGGYLYFYTKINFDNYEYSFLEKGKEVSKKIDFNIKSKAEYEKCLNIKTCNILAYYREDLIKTQLILTQSFEITDLDKISGNVLKLLENKEFLIKRWYKINDKIIFNKNNFTQNFLLNLYSKNIESYNFKKDNIFISKNDYEKYLKNYYYFSYNKAQNNSFDDIKNNKKYQRFDKNPLEILINRSNFYNTIITPPEVMFSYFLIINQIEKNIEKFNSKS